MATSDGEFTLSQFWVYASLVAFGYSFLSGAVYLGPHLAKAKRMWAEEGATSEEGRRIMRRLILVSRIELLVLIFIVWDMVAKPFT